MSPRLTVVSATANPGKLVEMAEILGDAVALETRPEGLADVDETGSTLEANAELKARAVLAFTGRTAMADDTGLEVDALGGEPGVRSARFAGEDAVDADNVALLLRRLDGVAAEQRTARFRTVICVIGPEGEPEFSVVVCEGRIATVPCGEGGFGYDPVFVPGDGDGRTFAEMASSEKNAISHRGRAVRLAAERLQEMVDGW